MDTTVAQAKLWDADEYLRLAELGAFREDEPVELLDGEIVRKMSPTGVEHGVCVSLIFEWLVRVKPTGMGLYPQATTRMSKHSVPEPDLAVLRKPARQFKKYPEASEIALVIEVADSSLALDRGRKALNYSAAGIAEYWIVNLWDRRIEVHREPGPDGYGLVKRYDEESIVHPLFAEVEVLVSDLLPSKFPEE